MSQVLVTRRRLLAAAVVVVAGVTAVWFHQPERQVRRAWRGLLATVEVRNASGLRRILADDYHDRWGYDRRSLSDDARLAFFQFHHLAIRMEAVEVRLAGDTATISAMIRIDAEGDGLVAEARATVNGLFTPFTFTWRREPGLAGAWKLVSFDHAELELERFRRRW